MNISQKRNVHPNRGKKHWSQLVGYSELEMENFRLKGEKVSRVAEIILENLEEELNLKY